MAKLTLKNGVTLGYKEVGSGDKVLLSTQNFFFTDCHMELLGKPPYDYHCYLITMRGYGESDHVFDATPQDWIKVWGEDVLAFADAIGAEQFYYTGVSHGCAAGWYTAFHQPHRLRGFAATSGVTQMTMPAVVQRKLDLDKIVGNREELAKIAWNTFYPSKDPKRLARREACRKEHLEIMLRRKREEFMVVPNTMSGSDAKTEEEFFKQLSEMNVPLMLVNGMLDPLSTPEKALKVASLVPGAKLITYEHWEHAGPDECPEAAARDCDRFFRDIQGRIL
jgi:pimeloyl-ACP methyl ester carboxylesterase